MNKNIHVSIKNKIAELSAPALIVCGNSDYVVEFNFDEEWAEHTLKTARFSAWNGYTDVVFEGTQCPVPVLSRASFVKVGVFAGDLHTTTPAYIPCKKSIRCEGGAPVEPKPDVYDRLIQMIEDGMLRGPQGEKGEKGDKGDAGSIKFIPVAVLPTEGIDESAIYIIPDPDGAEENRFIEFVYIDGAWEQLGKISVQVDHSEYVKKTDYATKGGAHGLVKIDTPFGIGLPNGASMPIGIIQATKEDIDGRTNVYRPIVSANLVYAVMSVILDAKAWTDEDKASFKALLGIE